MSLVQAAGKRKRNIIRAEYTIRVYTITVTRNIHDCSHVDGKGPAEDRFQLRTSTCMHAREASAPALTFFLSSHQCSRSQLREYMIADADERATRSLPAVGVETSLNRGQDYCCNFFGTGTDIFGRYFRSKRRGSPSGFSPTP